MAAWLESLLERLAQVPEALLLIILGLAAALENFVPPLPADVLILFGGFLAGKGAADLRVAFLVVWLSNVAGALAVYGLGHAYGGGFFAGRLGAYLLKPRQLSRLSEFYHRFGFAVIFFSRFLPMFRSLVPVFAGVSHLGFVRTAVPIALASGLWYGALLYAGAAAGKNWPQIVVVLELAGRWLYIPVVLAAAALLVWWWRSRHEQPSQ